MMNPWGRHYGRPQYSQPMVCVVDGVAEETRVWAGSALASPRLLPSSCGLGGAGYRPRFRVELLPQALRETQVDPIGIPAIQAADQGVSLFPVEAGSRNRYRSSIPVECRIGDASEIAGNRPARRYVKGIMRFDNLFGAIVKPAIRK